MKLEDACKKQGCKDDMYCFGGKDKTLDNTLCEQAIWILFRDMMEGIIELNVRKVIK